MAQSYSASYQNLTHNEIIPFAATWTNLKSVVLSEVREGEISYHIPSMWNLRKIGTNEPTYKAESDSQTLITNLWLSGEGIVREFGMDMYTRLYLKWITKKDLLHSMWNSAQCYVAPWTEGEFGGEWSCMFMHN